MSKETRKNIDDLFSKEKLEKQFTPTDADWSAIKSTVLSGDTFEFLDGIFSKDKLEQDFQASENDWEEIKDDVLNSDQVPVDHLFTAESLNYDFVPDDEDWHEAKNVLDPNRNVDLLFTKSRMNIEFIPLDNDWDEIKNQIVSKKKRRWPIVLIFLVGLAGLSALIWYNNDVNPSQSIYPLVKNSNSSIKSIDKDESKAISINDEKAKTSIANDASKELEDNTIRLQKKLRDNSVLPSTRSMDLINSDPVVASVPLKIEKEQATKMDERKNGSKNSLLLGNQKDVVNIELKLPIRDEGGLSADIGDASDNRNAIDIKSGKDNVQKELILEIENASKIEDLAIGLLSLDRINPTMQIIPVKRSWKRGIRASFHSNANAKIMGAYLGIDIVKLSNRLTLDAGLTYSYLDHNAQIRMEEQSIYSFGVFTRSATLNVQDIHYLGTLINLDYQLYRGLSFSLGINPKYRINARGRRNYYSSRGENDPALINLSGEYTKAINISVIPQIKYNFRNISLGVGYEYYSSDGIHESSEYQNRNRASIIVSLSTNF